MLHEAADRGDEQGELGLPVGAAPDRRRRPGRLRGHEPLPAPLGREQAVGEREHLRAAPIVAVQGHLAGRRETIGEAGQEGRRRAGEGVDRLVLVADHAQVVAVTEPELEEALLERVRVLVLVDAEPAVAGSHRLGRHRVDLQQLDRPGQHVVEVEAAGPVLLPLVVRPEAHEELDRDGRCSGAGLARVGRRHEAPALRPFDLVGQVLRRREAVAAREPPGEATDDRDLGVEHGGRRLAVVVERPEVAQLGQGRRVEGPGGDGRQAERTQTRDHLAGRLVGERDDEDPPRVHGARRDRVGDPVADHARLAGPGARVHDKRPTRDPDGLDLGRIQAGEERLGVEVGHPVASGWRQRRPGKRLKSRSVVIHSLPDSIASAAR